MAGKNTREGERFRRVMNRYADLVEHNATRIQRQAFLLGDQTIVLLMPVDTGRARSNCLASSGVPDLRIIEPYVPRPPGTGRGDAGNAQGAIDQAREIVAAHQPGDILWFTNNLPYVDRLNKGWSDQAPAGFFEQGVLAMREFIGRQLLLVEGIIE